MNLEKAIEILEKEQEDTFMGSEKDWKQALKLGSEGLKRIKNGRIYLFALRHPKLPGETDSEEPHRRLIMGSPVIKKKGGQK